jgi:hypothetical protein
LAQTWEVNALSRCNSTFRTISAKELLVGEPEGLNTQGHSEQPQPRKRFSSIQMSLRRRADSFARVDHADLDGHHL